MDPYHSGAAGNRPGRGIRNKDLVLNFDTRLFRCIFCSKEFKTAKQQLKY